MKTSSKRILIFTNDDDPFGSMTGAMKADMIRTTTQRAKVSLFMRLHAECGYFMVYLSRWILSRSYILI